MPVAVVAVGAVVVAIFIAVGAMILVRRRFGVPFLAGHNQVAGHVYGVLGSIYGVLLAFVVATVWQRYVEADEIVEREANALADLYRTAEAYPDAAQRRFRERLRAYARLVPQEEWGMGAHGVGSDEAWHAYNAIWHDYLSYSPTTQRERIWHQQSVRHLSTLGDQRRMRLLRTESTIPTLLWVVLYAVGIVTVAYSYFFGVPNVWSHALMTGALAGTIGLILALLIALEHPFDGFVRVEPDAYTEVLKVMHW